MSDGIAQGDVFEIETPSQRLQVPNELSEFVTERETTVSYSPGDPVVRIWTNVAKHLRAFRDDSAYTETRTWPAEPPKHLLEAAEFTIPRNLYEVARGRRRPRGAKTPGIARVLGLDSEGDE